VRIALGSDHAGIILKNELKRAFDTKTSGDHSLFTVIDVGTHNKDSVDYPDFALKVAEGVATNAFDRGILVCGSGIGMSIAANKVAGVRAALIHDVDSARLCREHNDANIIALAGRTLDTDTAMSIVKVFLETNFEGGRHQRRLQRITEIEQQPKGRP
tara:strand:+ start:260 stop:733 length:474 start_codon:yes stop_codon:yes gene_type:complete